MSVVFRNQFQRNACCLALLAPLGEKRVRYWDAGGPTMGARAAVVGRAEYEFGLSRGELVMIRIALDVWAGTGDAPLLDVMEVLDARNTQLVCTLILAANDGSLAIDAWIALNEIKDGVKKARGTNVHPIRRRKA